jgi:ABC-2 type transport system ATP-binding protein
MSLETVRWASVAVMVTRWAKGAKRSWPKACASEVGRSSVETAGVGWASARKARDASTSAAIRGLVSMGHSCRDEPRSVGERERRGQYSHMTPANQPAWAIDLSQVDKMYKGKVHALRGIEMRVAKGEIFGLLGPNGAGKSTLVKILMTVIRPTTATGTVLDMPVGHKPTLARVGYLPEHHRFPDYLTGAQVVEFAAAMCGVSRSDRKTRTPALLELVGMKDWGGKKVGGYSKGMRQRVGIAQALANDPDLVVLDEPTDGVDPVGRRDIREMLTRIKEQGKTVFLNSHLLSELEMVCDRVAILVQGKVKSQGTIADLTDHRRFYEIEVAQDLGEALGAALSSAMAMGVKFEIEPRVVRVRTPEAEPIQGAIDAIRARGGTIRAVRLVRPSLEDLFMEAVKDPNSGGYLRPGAAKDAAKGGN